MKTHKALVCFVTGGDPPIEQLPEILSALSDGGADIIEIGIPFSDPIADGPTIQAASQRALDRGTTVDQIFDAVQNARIDKPIVFMGYTNTAMRVGFDSFAKRAAATGASGVILSDLAPDDCAEWMVAAKSHRLDSIFLAAPTSTHDRIALIVKNSTGFVYCVSRTGVTGVDSEVPLDVALTVSRIKEHTELPVYVGFGISTPEHVRMVCDVADGAVVGSHIVSFLHHEWNNGEGRGKFETMIRSLKAATEA
ncbi:MAG: tryptophan synthase subunit alpha [Armatimonadota bacterium]|nr:tryptophan synthase subunit alpha [Armatimonadota bacterium]